MCMEDIDEQISEKKKDIEKILKEVRKIRIEIRDLNQQKKLKKKPIKMYVPSDKKEFFEEKFKELLEKYKDKKP